MHVNSSYSSYGMYSAEARNRFFYLPMPTSTYYTPWLWIDGDYSAGSGYSNWENLIVQRYTIPSPITARIWGDYNPTTRSGTIYARFVSDSSNTLMHNVLFVITEDSIQRSVPNGDQWHNHVARDYIPDHIGTPVVLRYQDSVTVSYPFTISSSWVDSRCEIIAMLQDPNNVNITKRVTQGAKIRLPDLPLTAVEEPSNVITNYPTHTITVTPNPVVNQMQVSFTSTKGSTYKLSICDISGRTIKTLNGIASGNAEHITINLKQSPMVSSGVYFYRFESGAGNTTGKIVVR
jgi:hypothetical protein